MVELLITHCLHPFRRRRGGGHRHTLESIQLWGVSLSGVKFLRTDDNIVIDSEAGITSATLHHPVHKIRVYTEALAAGWTADAEILRVFLIFCHLGWPNVIGLGGDCNPAKCRGNKISKEKLDIDLYVK